MVGNETGQGREQPERVVAAVGWTIDRVRALQVPRSGHMMNQLSDEPGGPSGLPLPPLNGRRVRGMPLSCFAQERAGTSDAVGRCMSL